MLASWILAKPISPNCPSYLFIEILQYMARIELPVRQINYPSECSISMAVFAVLLFLLPGCRRSVHPPAQVQVVELTPLEQLEALRLSEPVNGFRRDTVMLDFQFGMTRKQLTNHTMRLAKEGKMYTVPKGKNRYEYVYDLQVDQLGKLRTYFDASFHRDSLYRIECLPTIPAGTSHLEVLEQTAALYSRKYGQPSVQIAADSLRPGGGMYWIQGNREIELFADAQDRVVIHYVDLKREKRANKDLDI